MEILKTHDYNIAYNIIRSKRKTIAVEIKLDGSVVVRAPYSMPSKDIVSFVEEKADWITEHLIIMKKRRQQKQNIDWNAIKKETVEYCRGEGGRQFMRRLKYWAIRMNVTYGKVVVRDQKTRWGSCSAKGNLNFNWKLFAMPEELRDYVMVHELAHRKEMNHSEAFWKIVSEQLPDYKKLRKKLQEYG